MSFGTWNIGILYKAGVAVTVSRELSRYRLDLVGAREGSGTAPAEYTFYMERGMRTMNFVQVFLYIRESSQQLRGLSLLVIGCHT
jgi:hypothetical protein